MFKSSDLYENKNNNFTIERTHNNMAINGNNIINSFNKNNKLIRNFSGILKNDASQPKNEFTKFFK